MSQIHDTRLTLWLQTKGLLIGVPAPAKRMALIEAVRQYAPEWIKQYGDIKRNSHLANGVVVKFCEDYQVSTAKKRPKDLQAMAKINRIAKKGQRLPKINKNKFDSSFVNSDAFLQSYEWRVIRMKVLKRDGAICACCGATRADGVRMHVDHIKPRRIYPQLALDENNLQVLCEECNHGKSNWDMTDWRTDPKMSDIEKETNQRLKYIFEKRD